MERYIGLAVHSQTTHSEWLHEALQPHVHDLVVVQPSRSTGHKSDSIDAWALADMVRRGGIDCAVFKAPGKYRELRAAVRAHRALVGDVVRTKNRLKAIYRARGLRGMGDAVYKAEHRDAWISRLPKHRRKLAELLSRELDALSDLRREAEEDLLHEGRGLADVQRLATAPGIGLIRAAQIVAVVISPHRFRTRQQFWSYCGLGIVTRSSADWERDGRGGLKRKRQTHTRGLNRNRQPVLKAIFKGAALSVVQSMREHPLHEGYQRLVKDGLAPAVARVAIARRIASAVLAMWKKQEEYDPAKHRRVQDAP